MNFKVGDLVETIDSRGHGNSKLGDIGTIIGITEGETPVIYIITKDKRKYGMFFYRFRLVTPKEKLPFQTISLSGEENKARVKRNFPFLKL